jgi:CysZ protein
VEGIAIASLLVGLDFLDGPLERRRLRFRRKLGLMLRQWPTTGSFSLVCLALVSIPLVNLVLVPLCVIGGTLLVCDRLLPPSVPSGNPSGSSSTISPRDSDDRVTK